MRAHEFYIEINNIRYPIMGHQTYHEPNFDNRDTIHVKLKMTYAQAIELFQNNMEWYYIHYRLKDAMSYEYDDYGPNNPNCWEEVKTNWTPYCIAGPILDRRDGTLVVQMGRLTPVEEAVQEVMKNSITIDEIMAAFAEGVNEI